MSKGFPTTTVKRIMKQAGAERASDEAAQALADALNEIAFEISKKAVELMNYSGRKTVNGNDIKLAASQ
jgi:histone H3/H4